MASKSLTLTNPTVFTNGVAEGDNYIIGYDNNGSRKRIIRYEFTAPAAGARTFSITKRGTSVGSDNNGATFGFYITTDASSYANADGTYTHFSLSKGTTFSGSCDFLLLPNKKYYVWFFPTKKVNYGWYYWNNKDNIEASGEEGAGIVKIYVDGTWKNALTYIYTESGWKLALPWVYTSNGWKNTC